MTTTELWQALRTVLISKGATEAWIEYAMPELQIAASQYASYCYGNGHDDARRGWPLPNPDPTDPPLNIVTEADGSRWLELLPEKPLDQFIAESEAAQAPPLSADSPEARAQLARAFEPDDTLLDGFGPAESMIGGNA
jgi:hypothetical protein